MALIKGSGIVSEARGTIGGVVYSRNRYGMYARSWAKPTNPNTSAQIAARGNLGAASQAWSGLTTLQRIGWDDYAAATPVVNRLGESVTRSGYQWFVATHAFRASVPTLAQVLSAPLTPGIAGPQVLTNAGIDLGASAAVSSNLTSLLDPESAFVIDISLPVGPGVTYYGGPWRRVAHILGAEPPPASLSWAMVGNPWQVQTLSTYFLRGRAIVTGNKLTNWTVVGPITVLPA